MSGMRLPAVIQRLRDPKGWDGSNRLDDMVHRVEPTKLTARVQSYLRYSTDGEVIATAGPTRPRVGNRDLRGVPQATAARRSSEAIMAGLVVVFALIMTITAALVGGFLAISFAISRGHRVRSVIWRRTDHPGQGTRPLTGSNRWL